MGTRGQRPVGEVVQVNVNKVCISGNLTRDCQVYEARTGTLVYNFSVAVSNRKRNRETGEWEDVPAYVDCKMFDKTGAFRWMADNLRKGMKVMVGGALDQPRWVDKETGGNRSKLEVIVHELDADWPKRQDATQGTAQHAPSAPQYAAAAPQGPQTTNYPSETQTAPQQSPTAPETGPYDEDIPF